MSEPESSFLAISGRFFVEIARSWFGPAPACVVGFLVGGKIFGSRVGNLSATFLICSSFCCRTILVLEKILGFEVVRHGLFEFLICSSDESFPKNGFFVFPGPSNASF